MTAGLATLLLPLFLAGGGPSNDDCLTCHSDPQARSEKGRSVFVDAKKHAQSTHGGLSCVDCHEGIQELPHAGKLKKPACTACHEDAAAAVKGSVHGAFGEEACSGCHGPGGGGKLDWAATMKVPPVMLAPAIAAQHPAYLERQLVAYKSGSRANDSGHVMRDIASRLSSEEIAALARYIATLSP